MDAKEFLEIVHQECDKSEYCSDCKFYIDDRYKCGIDIAYLNGQKIEEVVAIAEEIKANRKTYKDDFLSKFPSATLDKDGYPLPCIHALYGSYKDCDGLSCKECWNEEYKES